jgi:hypothetical protein
MIYCFFYSVRNDYTGFAIAAFIAWKITDNIAISNAIIPAAANTQRRLAGSLQNTAQLSTRKAR